jgi:hypothetical protein
MKARQVELRVTPFGSQRQGDHSDSTDESPEALGLD